MARRSRDTSFCHIAPAALIEWQGQRDHHRTRAAGRVMQPIWGDLRRSRVVLAADNCRAVEPQHLAPGSDPNPSLGAGPATYPSHHIVHPVARDEWGLRGCAYRSAPARGWGCCQ